MGRAIKECGRPVFAALGYEFDGQHPHQPREYAAVFRRIHDAWDRLGVTNVAYVWHTFTDNLNSFDRKANKTEAQLGEYYPGDKYVNY
jgi:beta-mannanase